MPFEIAETMFKATEATTKAGVRYMRIRTKKHGPSGLPKLIITLPTTIFVSKAKQVNLLLGTGADDKKIRIKAATSIKNAAKVTDFKKHVMLRFGHVPKWGDDIFDTMHVDIKKISVDEYELDLTPTID